MNHQWRCCHNRLRVTNVFHEEDGGGGDEDEDEDGVYRAES